MERHLIIIDLDGTLMLDFSHYDQETIDYLNKLTKDGHIIMIATGRPLRSSFFVYQAIGLNSPIINYNGALVKHPFDDKFPKTDLRVEREDLVKIFEEKGIATDAAEVIRKADMTVEVTDVKVAEQIMRLVERLEDLDDVQMVTANYEIADEIADQLEG